MGPYRVQYGKKFLSLEKFFTHIVADVADYYEVWVGGSPQRPKKSQLSGRQNFTHKNFPD